MSAQPTRHCCNIQSGLAALGRCALHGAQASARIGSLVSVLFGMSVATLPAAAATPAAAANPKASDSATATITEDQAKAAALKAMPGKVTGVSIEKKRGKTVYVVEIMTETKGERDVFIDRVSGKVIGTD